MKRTAPRLLTVGEIAARLHVPIHRVQYVVRVRGVSAAALAGRTRLFDNDALARVRHEIEAMAARAAASAGGPSL